MDRIRLSGIRVHARLGVTANERAAAQPLDVDVTIECDLSAASRSDEFAETIDYARLHARIVAAITGASYALLERLARAILDAVFVEARVVRAEVTVAKPSVLDGATPSVTLVRSNDLRS